MKPLHSITFFFILILDRLTKYFFQGSNFSFTGHLLTLKTFQNQSLFFWQIDRRFLIVFSLIALAVLIFVLIKNRSKGKFLLMDGLFLVVLGGVSNLFDRIFLGYVIDFIRVFFLPFFTFNISDIMITTGCFLVAIYYLPTTGIRQKN